MPIILVTGMPGHGKSLWTIKTVKERAEKEERQVVYYGIKDLKLPWTPLEKPDDWCDAPAGSIIVIDECQKLFRMRSVGQSVPRYVSELETHRHRGLDIYLITQHPMLLDTAVRRLIDTHYHVKRPFGMSRTVIHESTGLMEKPDQVRKDTIRHNYVFKKEDFENYTSAEIHTVKAKIPVRIVFIVIAPLMAIGLGIFAYKYVYKHYSGQPQEQLSSNPEKPENDKGQGVKPAKSEHLSKDEYIAQFQPRISGLAFTAPVYDAVMQVRTAPKPKACIQSKEKCVCYSQQATKMDVPADICSSIVKNGYFDFTRDEKEGRNDFKQAAAKNDDSLRNPVRPVPAGNAFNKGQVVATAPKTDAATWLTR